MDKIIIRKNPNGDTRTAPKDVKFDEFQKANDSHRKDVFEVMHTLAEKLNLSGIIHDWTKKEINVESSANAYEHLFYHDFKETMNGNLNFVEGEWYKMHVNKERHHLLSHCPDDVNLIDVIEMVVDCTVAGLARIGKVRPMEINSDILMKAVENTSKMIVDMCEVVE